MLFIKITSNDRNVTCHCGFLFCFSIKVGRKGSSNVWKMIIFKDFLPCGSFPPPSLWVVYSVDYSKFWYIVNFVSLISCPIVLCWWFWRAIRSALDYWRCCCFGFFFPFWTFSLTFRVFLGFIYAKNDWLW